MSSLSRWSAPQCLSDAEAEVWVSRKNGLTPTEIAANSDRDPSTVRTLLSRARGKLDEDTGR